MVSGVQDNNFVLKYDEDKSDAKVEPLFVYFQGEDLERYCQRIFSCHQRRRHAESLLKYNFCIDNMPTDKVSTCPDFVLQKISNQALSTQELSEGRSELGVEELCDEVAIQYSRTMNKMIFDKVIGTEQERHLLKDLELPPEPEKEAVAWKGTGVVLLYEVLRLLFRGK